MDENNNYSENYQSEPQYEQYQAGDYQYYEEPRPSNGFGIASMVLGILALVLFCSCINIPLGILSIIFGVVQLSKGNGKKGFAIAGIITSIISVVLMTVMILMFVIGGMNWLQTPFESQIPFNDIIEEYYGDEFYGDEFYGDEYSTPSGDESLQYEIDEKNDL